MGIVKILGVEERESERDNPFFVVFVSSFSAVVADFKKGGHENSSPI